MFIYKITCVVTGKVYVGMDTGPEQAQRRWKSHSTRPFSKIKRGISPKTKLERSMVKYGASCHAYEVIDRAITVQELRDKEEFWIAHYDAVRTGLNILPGSNGYTLSEIEDVEWREHLRAIRRDGTRKLNEMRWANTTPEYRRAASAHLNSDAMIAARSAHVKAEWDNMGSHEKQHKLRGLDEYRRNNRDAFLEQAKKNGRIAAEKAAKKIIATDPCGNTHTYESMKDFYRKTGMSASHVLKKTTNGTDHKGWKAYELGSL